MTALDVLKEFKDYLIILGRRNSKTQDMEKAKIIVEALEKQIPKKPKDDGWLYCPVCGKDVCVEKPKHCSVCGQALDWSDTE